MAQEEKQERLPIDDRPLTDGEKQYFDSRGEKDIPAPEPEKPAEAPPAAAEAPADAIQPAETGKPADTGQPANVPQSALHEERKRRQEVAEFSAESDLPLRIALLVDTSNSIRDRFRFEQEAASEFVKSVIKTKQDKALVTKAPKLTKEHGLIDWTRTAEQVCNHVRAMQPWPTAYTFWHHAGRPPLRLIVCKAVALPGQAAATSGPAEVVDAGDTARLLVAAGQQTVVELA